VVNPLVVVCLGTDHHPFDRLARWARDLADEGWVQVHLQHGATAVPESEFLLSSELMGLVELRTLMESAAAVVTHGGPGLIVDAHLAGHRPVVVPRDPTRGEHVDGHQMRFVSRIGEGGPVVPAHTYGQFREAVACAGISPRGPASLPGASSGAAEKFGRLVEELVAR